MAKFVVELDTIPEGLFTIGSAVTGRVVLKGSDDEDVDAITVTFRGAPHCSPWHSGHNGRWQVRAAQPRDPIVQCRQGALPRSAHHHGTARLTVVVTFICRIRSPGDVPTINYTN